MLTDEKLDDLIGGAPKPPPPLDREALKDPGRFTEHQHANAAWFSRALGIDLATAEEQLSDCPVAEIFEGEKLYVVAQACPFLLPSEIDLAGHVKSLRADDLPPQLQPEFWLAKLKRLEVEREDGRIIRWNDVQNAITRPTYQFRQLASMAFWGAEHSGASLLDVEREELRNIVDRMLVRVANLIDGMHLVDKTRPVVMENIDDL